MKKIYLKSWLEELLIKLELLLVIILTTTIEGLLDNLSLLFIVITIFTINGYLLIKYGKTIIKGE